MTAHTLPRFNTAHSLRTFAHDVAQGFMAITHNSLALLGMALAMALIAFSAHADLRTTAERHLLGWLMQRQFVEAEMVIPAEPEAIERVTALLPSDLPKEQALLTQWLSRKYRVAPEPLAALVAESYRIGGKIKIDPTLILAVMAVESSFNPFAHSSVGAQGLMQVMTRVHQDKYENFGGQLAAFDPLTNLRVGVKVLQDCIRSAGSVEGGLRLYVGAVTTDGSDYVEKVLMEQERLQNVAQGQRVAVRSAPVASQNNAESTGIEPSPSSASPASQTDSPSPT